MHSFLSFGRLHLPVFGLFAAAGLMAAMTLGLRTARRAGVDRDGFWNAGMVAVFSAFLLSRGLIVAENPRIFLAYPLLVLELPPLTGGGLFLTAVVTVAYLRRRRLPLLNALDAVVPCAALLGVFLEMGRMAEGTREGMPTTARWAITSAFGQVHPVEIYSAIAWLALCAALLWLLGLGRCAGETAATGMVLGGLLLFLLDFFRLPSELYTMPGIASWLDVIQWRAVGLMVAGSLLLVFLVGGREGVQRNEAVGLGAEDVGDAF